MTKTKIKKVLINFLVCIILSILVVAIWSKIKGDEPNLIGMFFYLMIMALPSAILQFTAIYFIFLGVAILLSKKISNKYVSFLLLIIFGALYCILILKMDWYFAKDRYHSYEEFIKDPDAYLSFTIISVVQIILFQIFSYRSIAKS